MIEQLEDEGYSASTLRLDVTDDAGVRAVAAEAAAAHGRIDVLINKAGVPAEAENAESTESVDVAIFRDTFATSVIGTVSVLEAFLPLLRVAPGPRLST